jgi:hypothetical protein
MDVMGRGTRSRRIPSSRLIAGVGALLLTLVVAAPVAANQKVHVDVFSGSYGPFEVEVRIADGWWFQCSRPIYYGGWGQDDLWLWYPNGVTEFQPEGVAWPWTTGQYVHQGVDYFSSRADMSGKVVSGKFKFENHQNHHHLGTPNDPNDPEWWIQTTAGRSWGIEVPGYGPVFHEAFNVREKLTVTGQVPGPFDPIDVQEIRAFHGVSRFDAEALCASFGYGVTFAP